MRNECLLPVVCCGLGLVMACGPLDGNKTADRITDHSPSTGGEHVSSLEQAFRHGPPPGPGPWHYTLTSYGGPSDGSAFGQTPACGGRAVDGTGYYATGAYSFGCNSKLELRANGKCVVVEVRDNGPAASVESRAASRCGGLGYIIDASPEVSRYLYNTSSAGWSDCYAIDVQQVASSTPVGPCNGSGGTVPPIGGGGSTWGTCSVGGQVGVCQETSSACNGSYHSGYCPGPSSVQCCVASGSGGGCVPQPETCNNRDDDCNGMVDEGNPQGGMSCNTTLAGECATGVEVCSGGQLVCQPLASPSVEVCDGKDNDCNGVIDDVPGGCGSVGNCVPRPELCNGHDDDCDGRIDNGDPGGGSFCSTGQLGECQRGMSSCQGGRIVCLPLKAPTAETCDGLDNDCNGLVDDAPGCGTGGQCNPAAQEICNGRDDNCNGQIDEGNPGGGMPCFAAGLCPTGVTVCQGGVVHCEARPSVEVCDGLDNDCNGVVDDVDGGCQSTCTPQPEVCNGRDDDCDGFPDNHNPGGGAPCLLASGARGTIQCVQGQLVCWQNDGLSIQGSSGCSLAHQDRFPGLWLLLVLVLWLGAKAARCERRVRRRVPRGKKRSGPASRVP